MERWGILDWKNHMRLRSIPIGLILALLLVGVAAAQSGGPYDLGWSTLDGGGGMFSTGGTHTDPDAGVIGNTAHSHYYLIRSVHGGLISTGSNRVGAFAFGLTPGSP